METTTAWILMKGSGQVNCATHLFSFPSLDLTPSSKFLLLSKNYLRTRNRLVCAQKSYFSDITSFELLKIRIFFYIPLKIYKTNYLLHYLLITLRNTTRTIIPRGAMDYDNPVAINIERNKNYWVNQERCTTRPQSRTQEPPTDSHNLSRIDGASKRLKRSYAQASVEKFRKYGTNRACGPAPRLPEQAAPLPRPTQFINININTIKKEIYINKTELYRLIRM